MDMGVSFFSLLQARLEGEGEKFLDLEVCGNMSFGHLFDQFSLPQASPCFPFFGN